MSYQNLRTKALPRVDVKILVNFLVLSGVATLLPALIHIQWVTGPIVNAILFLSVVLVGGRNAILIGLIPSIMALFFGLLPTPLAPMIPFIMIGNAILIVIFDMLKNNYWLGVFVASGVKFLFLYFSYSAIIDLIFKKDLAPKIAQMLSWPQFATAVLGGIIAFGILKILKYKKFTDKPGLSETQ
ncbi:iron hydrogenase [Candidatus Falkowbacteria bacterium]|jgi:hypothetical protein|nr:iron hydrogenase [Candidatus Falkowbacteria bacterium]MBT4433077.1 iron hydrogenase [Candidatus Falkowbacteria bacterium]